MNIAIAQDATDHFVFFDADTKETLLVRRIVTEKTANGSFVTVFYFKSKSYRPIKPMKIYWMDDLSDKLHRTK